MGTGAAPADQANEAFSGRDHERRSVGLDGSPHGMDADPPNSCSRVRVVLLVRDEHGGSGVARDTGRGDLRVIGLLEAAVACAEQTR